MKIKAKLSVSKGSGNRKSKSAACQLSLRIDPKSGALEMTAEGKCRPEMIKKLNAAVRERGIVLPPTKE